MGVFRYFLLIFQCVTVARPQDTNYEKERVDKSLEKQVGKAGSSTDKQ
jgi:hypothetical protein